MSAQARGRAQGWRMNVSGMSSALPPLLAVGSSAEIVTVLRNCGLSSCAPDMLKNSVGGRTRYLQSSEGSTVSNALELSMVSVLGWQFVVPTCERRGVALRVPRTRNVPCTWPRAVLGKLRSRIPFSQLMVHSHRSPLEAYLKRV